MREWWTLFCVAVVFVLLGAPSVRAQQPDLDDQDPSAPITVVPGKIGVRARPIADGLVRDGEWSMVRVTIANGADSTRARVSMLERTTTDSGLQSYARTVELPQGSKKDVQLAWRVGSSTRDRQVDIAIGTEVTSMVFPVRMLRAEDVGIGVVGDDALGIVAVSDAWTGPVPGRAPRPRSTSPRKVRTGLLPLADLPEKTAGYAALDWVVWPRADPSTVDARQLDALLAWTASGGHLFVSVTDSWRAVAASPLATALPVELLGVEEGSVDALLAAVGGSVGGPEVPVATAVPKQGDDRNALVLTLLDDGRPGWVVGSYGLGTVHVLLADPSVGPLRSGVSREDLWRRLLWLPPPGATDGWYAVGPPDLTTWIDYGTPFFPDGMEADRLRSGAPRFAVDLGLACPTQRCLPIAGLSSFQSAGAWYDVPDPSQFRTRMKELLADIPGVAPLPLSWLAIFAGVYLLFIGPLDYLVLRALKRQPLTWITFPVMVVGFSAVALVGTSLVKGSQAIVTRYEVVDVLPGTGFWRGQTWLGVFSTKKTDLALSSGFDDAVVMPVDDGGFVQDPHTVSGEGSGRFEWRAQTWSLAYVQTAWTARQPGTIVLRALPGGLFEVDNRLGVDLEDAELRARGRTLSLGALPDGATRAVAVGGTEVPTLEDLATYVDDNGTYADQDDHQPARVGVAMLASYPEDAGGHLAVESPVGLVGRSTTPFEPTILEGLSPVERPQTVFRVPLTLAPVAAEAP